MAPGASARTSGLEAEKDGRERLAGLVVELAREPAPLLLLAAHDALHRRPGDPSRQVDRDGCPGSEPLGQAQVRVAEAGVGAPPVERHQHPDRLLADDQRRPEPRARADAAHQVGIGIRVVEHRVDARGRALEKDSSGLRALDGKPLADETLGALTVRRRDLEPAVRRRHEDGDEARVEKPAHALDHELEQASRLDLAQHRVRDLVERLELARPVATRLVQTRVLDRHRGLGGEERDHLLVLGCEVVPAGLLRQVEVSVGDASKQDGHAQKRPHGRVIRRKPHRAVVRRDVVQAQRPRVADQHPQDAAPTWQLPDRGVGLGVDAVGDEALELPAARVDDPERGIAGPGQLGGRLDEALEHRLERQLGAERDSGLDEPLKHGLLLLGAHAGIIRRTPQVRRREFPDGR